MRGLGLESSSQRLRGTVRWGHTVGRDTTAPRNKETDNDVIQTQGAGRLPHGPRGPGLGVRADDAITRERRTLRARYKLFDAGGKLVLDATAGSDVGIDVVSSEYATIAAENTALERLSGIVADQIVARIALFAEPPLAK